MNTFYEHHKSSINFAYRCFDRILLNGLIQPFQQYCDNLIFHRRAALDQLGQRLLDANRR